MIDILVKQDIKEETKLLLQQIKNVNYYFTNDINKLSSQQKEGITVILGSPTVQEMQQLPNVKYVQLFSAGANHVTWLDDSIILANAYGAYGDGIGEHMLATTLLFAKDLMHYYHQQQNHQWIRQGNIVSISGLNVLSVGMGSIGTQYLKLMDSLGANCYGVRRTIHDKPDFVKQLYTIEHMDNILPNFDIVALSLPSTNQTKGLFNYQKLSLMKKNSILINVGRGDAIVTDDLITLLNKGYFKGVALDVTDPEPLPQNNQLYNFNNVLITPHVSGGYDSDVNYQNVINVVIENLKRYINGQDPIHIVDKKLGY